MRRAEWLMSSKPISFILRQAVSLCMVAGLVAMIAAITAPDAVIVFAQKAANRVIENIVWLALLPANYSETFFAPYIVLSFGAAFLFMRRGTGEPLGWRAILGRIFPREVYL